METARSDVLPRAVAAEWIKEDALRIQDRFAAKPVRAQTGKGHLTSEGVATPQRIKAGLKKAPAH